MGDLIPPEPELVRRLTTSELARHLLLTVLPDPDAVQFATGVGLADRTYYGQSDSTELKQRLSDAWAWLIQNGFVGPTVNQPSIYGVQRITSAGLEFAKDPEGITRLHAATRLAGGLSPRLDNARANFERAAYATAIFEAFKVVEVEVRRVSGLPNRLIGTKLMEQAFSSNGGPLTDPDSESSEQIAIQQLFSGAMGALRNPSGHREIEYEDPIEAAEAVQLADLLLRILAKAERRLSSISLGGVE